MSSTRAARHLHLLRAGFGGLLHVNLPGSTSGMTRAIPPPPLTPLPPPPPLVLPACGISTNIDMDLSGSDLQSFIPQDSSAPVVVGVNQCCQTCVNNTNCFAWVYQASSGYVSGGGEGVRDAAEVGFRV